MSKKEPEDRPPLHIVNMTLNLTHGQDLAWQERKAESFTASRLHCGAAGALMEGVVPPDPTPPEMQPLGFRPTEFYGDRISLGTALTISGAAVSPNWGYHSSPAVAFILTFFNVRLGAWLGNPAREKWKTHAPIFGLATLIQEALGFSTRDRSYLYLSDGGHFDNLGLYEMVRRRCKYIIVADAGADGSVHFEDLANVVRKIRIDFGVEIAFTASRPIVSRFQSDGSPAAGAHYMVGTMSVGDKPFGTLLYIKASYYSHFPPHPSSPPGEAYMDVISHAELDSAFPHTSTADQFFTESMFESYRVLGYEIADQCL